MRTGAWITLAFVVLFASIGGRALAGDKAPAEAAFLQGKELMKQGKYKEACVAFEKSYDNDPQLGTQYNLALCYEQAGQLASAWTAFRELAQRDQNAARKADSLKHADKLQPRLIKLLINVRSPVAGLKVTRNGDDVTSSVGIESPVDPGDYDMGAEAPGYKPWTVKVVAKQEGGTVQVTVPELEKNPDAVKPPDDHDMHPLPPGPGTGVTTTVTPKSNRKVIGLGVAGGGVVATGVGLVFGLMAKGKWDDAKKKCPGPAGMECATAADKMMADDLTAKAKTAGNVSTVLVGVGLVAVSAGVVLYLTAPKSGGVAEEARLRLEPTVSPDGFAVTAVGHF